MSNNKKITIISIAISAVLLATCIIVPCFMNNTGGGGGNITIPVQQTFDEWDGTVGQVPSDYDEDGVIEIITAEEFVAVLKSGGKNDAYYKLTKDLYLNVKNSFNRTTGESNKKLNSWFNSGDLPKFRGTFDGDGHAIHGLYYKAEKQDEATQKAVALFPSVDSGAKIINVGLENSFIFAENTAAGILGLVQDAKGTLVDTCYVADSVTLNGIQVGGINGAGNTAADVRNTFSQANIVDADKGIKGGIFGNNSGGVNCENVYTSFQTIGGKGNVTGADWYHSITNPSEEIKWRLGDAFYYLKNNYPRLKIFNNEQRSKVGVWTGSISTPDDGSGNSADDPLIIKTAAELCYVICSGGETYTEEINGLLKTSSKIDGKYVKLENDIIINDINVQIENKVGVIYGSDGVKQTDTSSLLEWFINRNKPLTNVTIDGNGHVIRGLFFDEASTPSPESYNNGIGFINKGSGITIKNLGISDMWARHTGGSVAAFIGNVHQQNGNKIENCFVADDVYITGENAAAIFGGGDQTGSRLSVRNTYVLAMIDGRNSYGAVSAYVFNCESSSVSDFFTTSKLFGSAEMNTTRVYGEVTPYMAFGSATDGNKLTLSNEFHYVENSYPKLRVFTGYNNTWNGLADSNIQGSGTSYSPYIVKNAGQLAWVIANFGKNANYTVKLANDIVINDIDKIDWSNGTPVEGYTPIPWFEGNNTGGNAYTGSGGSENKWRGTFNGNGYTISGIWYPSDTKSISSGFIPAVADSVITNLKIDNSYIVADRFAGTVSAWSEGTTRDVEISKITVGKNVTLTCSKNYNKYDSKALGGITGHIENVVKLNDCRFGGRLSESRLNPAYIQGLFGDYWSAAITVNNCYSYGYSPSRISESSHTGKITITNSYYDIAHKDAKTDGQYTKLKTEEMPELK